MKHATLSNSVRSELNIVTACISVPESQETWVRYPAQKLDIPAGSLPHIFTQDFHIQSHEMHSTQQLMSTEHAQKRKRSLMESMNIKK